MNILLIAEHDEGRLRASTHSAVTAGLALGGQISLLVAGHGVAGVAQEAAQIRGVQQVLLADGPAQAHGLAENLAPLVLQLVQDRDFEVVLAAATSAGKNVLPRVAALLGVPMVSEITAIVDAYTFVRPMYAGNINATVRAPQGKRVVSIRPTAFVAASEQGGAAPVQAVDAGTDHGLSVWLQRQIVRTERPTLDKARVVVSGGRSLGSAERFQQVLLPLADKLHAAVGATRAAVDAGFAPNEWQVGQTGTVVAPELYIAIGVSGAAQHVAGIKDSKVIVAINHDPDAPIFQWADYGLVADLFESVSQIEQAL